MKEGELLEAAFASKSSVITRLHKWNSSSTRSDSGSPICDTFQAYVAVQWSEMPGPTKVPLHVYCSLYNVAVCPTARVLRSAHCSCNQYLTACHSSV